MSKTETIEEKTYRLMGLVYGTQPPFKTIKQTNYFKLCCQMLELAIAEEREANKSAYQALREMFNDGEELECDDGWRVGVDIDLWSLGIEAFDGLEAPATKDEVNQ